jgi:DNA invertase Pin-like site-specific DNA recombinase
MFRDNDLSASRNSTKVRPGWEAAEKLLYSGGVDVLIIWETSRAWRKLSEWILLVDACRDNNVLMHVTSHYRTYDPSIRRDRKTLIEEGVDSEDEAEKLAERVKRAFDANREQGKPHSRPPYGYEVQIDPNNPRQTIRVFVPEQAAIVREVIERVAKSHTLTAIRNDLNARGVPSPSVAQGHINPRSKGKIPLWSSTAVRNICTNRAYIGRRAYIDESSGREIVVPATWEAIIADDKLFYQAYDLLNDPERKKTIPERGKYLLSFVAQCGVCGNHICRMSGKENPMRYRCYSDRPCVTIRMDWLDLFVSELVCQRLAKKDVYELLTKLDDSKKTLSLELEALRVEHQGALDLRAKKKLSLVALSQEEERIFPRIAELEAGLRPVTVPRVVEDLAKDAKGNLGLLRARWNAQEIPAKKDVLRALFKSIKLHKSPILGRVNERQLEGVLRERVKVKWVND